MIEILSSDCSFDEIAQEYESLEEIEIIGNQIVVFEAPENDKFIDEGDCHAMEVYKAYSYTDYYESKIFFFKRIKKLEIYFSLEDSVCFLTLPTKEDVLESWSRYYKNMSGLKVSYEEKGIFNYKVEIKNSKTRVISYFKELEDEDGDKYVLECKMDALNLEKNKELEEKVEKIEQIFYKFVESFKFKDL